MKVLMTGSGGKVGEVLSGIDADITPFDLPDNDARDLTKVVAAAKGHDAIIHLAWNAGNEYCGAAGSSETIDPDNTLMYANAYKAAKSSGIQRVIMASSVHADSLAAPREGRLSPSDSPMPHCPYGANKVLMESLGRFYAAKGLGVVCLRLGAVRAEDEPGLLEESERHLWLGHEDAVSIVNKTLAEDLRGRFVVAYALSDNPGRIHDLVNPFDWQPK